jgi:hypothetical protein
VARPFIVATLGWVLLAASPLHVRASDPSVACSANHLKIAATYVACRLRVEAKRVRTGKALDFSRCDEKFVEKYRQYEEAAGHGECPADGRQALLNTKAALTAADLAIVLTGSDVPACARNAAALELPASGQTTSYRAGDDGDVEAGSTLQYVDNGDGTITDANTGLTWEKLSDDGTIHDRDNVYTWNDASDVKVATLNATSFAGHGDWRLPNVKELQSIVDHSAAAALRPSIDVIFDADCTPGCSILTCSCTGRDVPSQYWSSTSVAADTFRNLAWFVSFQSGEVYDYAKGTLLRVRAVRGGS